MKRIICLLCVLMVVVSFAGCNKDVSSDSQKIEESKIEHTSDSQEVEESKTEQTSYDKELSDEELAKIVAESLGVPDRDSIYYGISEMYYWDSSERYFKNVSFTEKGKMIASASVDPYNGELLRNIIEYDASK